jgi:hypothetical protein
VAERKFSFDKELAERRFKYDRDLHSHKRLTEFAEEVLADFYEARDDINAARSPGGFSSEGRTRPRGPDESEDDTATLNSYYSVAERLSKRTEFFSRLEARRYRFIAHFGLPAAEPYATLRAIHAEIVVTVRMLLMTHGQRQLGTNPSNIEAWRGTIWQISESDPTQGRLDAMVEAMERTCRPAIEESAR